MSYTNPGASDATLTNTVSYKYTYAFSVKDNRSGSEEYDKYINHLKKFGTIVQCLKEDRTKYGKPTKPHLHGTLVTNDKLYFKAAGLPGFHTHFKTVYNDNWTSYIHKNVDLIDWTQYQFSA